MTGKIMKTLLLFNKNAEYNINIWFYKPSTEDGVTWTESHGAKVEILEKCSNFVKGRKNVRILVWDEHSIGFVIIVVFGLPLNKNMKPMNAAHKPNQRLYALYKNKLKPRTITINKK